MRSKKKSKIVARKIEKNHQVFVFVLLEECVFVRKWQSEIKENLSGKGCGRADTRTITMNLIFFLSFF